MKSFIFFYFSILCIESLNINKYHMFKNKNIHLIFSDIINIKLKRPIIFNGLKSPLKKNFCQIFAKENNIMFKEYRFDSFMLERPYVDYENSLLYINDFLIGNGRIFNHYEQNILLNINRNSNLIVFQADDIKNIPFKDNNIIRRFPIIEFPKIDKKEIIQYIYDTITINKYNSNLYDLNWNKYDVEKLDFEKINILLYELHCMNNDNIELIFLQNNINNIIDDLYSLNDIN